MVNQVHHDLDFVELVHVDFVFLLLARQNESELSFCSCFVRRFGIAHASMALRSLNHNLHHRTFLRDAREATRRFFAGATSAKGRLR